ncbi:hypothetical protein OROGR_016495 [Orobanche gracilis]
MEVTRPLSPKNIGEYYFSAPTSPSHLSRFYNKNSDALFASGNDTGGYGLSSTVPFDWEEKPGTPKSPGRSNIKGDDFAFDMSRNYETAPLSAEELFDGGLIKPLKPPPWLHQSPAARSRQNPGASPRKSISPTRKVIHGALFSQRLNNIKARSLSPIRGRQFSSEDKEGEEVKRNPSASAPGKCNKKWRLKDFFLFRSASEGHAVNKYLKKKYMAALRRTKLRGDRELGVRCRFEDQGTGVGSRAALHGESGRFGGSKEENVHAIQEGDSGSGCNQPDRQLTRQWFRFFS